MTEVTYTSKDLGSPEADRAYETALENTRSQLPFVVRSSVAGEELPGAHTVLDVFPGDTTITVARVEEASPAVVDRAVAAARAANRDWGRRSWSERATLIHKVADNIANERLEIAAVIAWETGKVRAEAVGEVDEVVALLHYYARSLEENKGYTVRMGIAGEDVTDAMRPWGVWGVISPFNFPFAAGAGMVAGALLGGNTVVYKPTSETALSGLLLFRYLASVLPPGVIQFVVGDGLGVGAAMVEHPGIDGFSFTGSRDVGVASVASFNRERPRPFVAEMGGKNPVVVCESADVTAAAAGIVQSAFRFSGQKCSAASRVYAHQAVYSELLEVLAATTTDLTIGNPHKVETFTGPVINEQARDRFASAMYEARRAGRIVAGGRVLDGGELAHGYFVEPTVSTDLPVEHPHFATELFLPYVPVAPVDSLEEAIERVNAVPFGLVAGIFTTKEPEIEAFFDRVEAGTVYANRSAGATAGAWPGVQAFGGWKESGSTGRHALGPRYVPQFMREQSRTVVR
jgi:1-pyrroline-5-carboxylate dehydrogenase